jgi:phosphohistidine phosphatase
VDLYFVRHATAASKSTWLDDDSLRPLTRAGRHRFAHAAAALARSGALQPSVIVSSPLVRARQTADVLANALAAKASVLEDARLGIDFDIAALRAILAENCDLPSIAIVGHNPSFATVLSALIGGASIAVAKGTIALVEVSDISQPAGRLVWLAPPELLSPNPALT